MTRAAFRILGPAPAGWPDASRLLLCEGLRRPVRSAHWRAVGWIDREAPAVVAYFAVIAADRALEDAKVGARATFLSDPAEHKARARAALERAASELRAARREADAALAAHPVPIDPRLGFALVLGDCDDVVFVEK